MTLEKKATESEKNKILIVEDMFFDNKYENFYKIIYTASNSIRTEMDEVFNKINNNTLAKYFITHEDGISGLLSEYNKK